MRYGGRVVDFLNVGLGPVRTGIFNVADMAIMAGVILLIVQPMVVKGRRESAQA
jgi:signal peptidase II